MADINAYYYTITHSGFEDQYGYPLISAKEFINLALDNNTPISDINIGTIIFFLGRPSSLLTCARRGVFLAQVPPSTWSRAALSGSPLRQHSVTGRDRGLTGA